jgi:hypothetical protein
MSGSRGEIPGERKPLITDNDGGDGSKIWHENKKRHFCT